jgi:hypothetical protein
VDDGVQLATAQWGAGDRAGWRRTCEELVARRTEFAGDADTLTAVALVCSLQPAVELGRPLAPLLDTLCFFEYSHRDLHAALTLLWLRQNQAPRFRNVPKDFGDQTGFPQAQLVQALVQHRTGTTDAARATLDSAQKWLLEHGTKLDWPQRVVVETLRREVAQTVSRP